MVSMCDITSKKRNISTFCQSFVCKKPYIKVERSYFLIYSPLFGNILLTAPVKEQIWFIYRSEMRYNIFWSLHCCRQSTLVQPLQLSGNTSGWQGNNATKDIDLSRSSKITKWLSKLLEDIIWTRPNVDIATYQLKHLYSILLGD